MGFSTEKLDQAYFPAEFIYQKFMMEANVIHQAFISCEKIIFLVLTASIQKQPLKICNKKHFSTGFGVNPK